MPKAYSFFSTMALGTEAGFVNCNLSFWPMSALGQKQTCASQKAMSALPPKADMCGATAHVRFVPIATLNAQTEDHLTAVLRFLRQPSRPNALRSRSRQKLR